MKKLVSGAIVLTSLLCLASCIQSSDSPTPEPTPGHFDFSTTTKATLNIAYNTPQGYSFLCEVFDTYPLKTVDRGEMQDLVRNDDICAVTKMYTDKNGAFAGTVIIPAATKKLYLYSGAVGVERLMVMDVNNGIISAPRAIEETNIPTKNRLAKSATRSGEADTYKLLGGAVQDGSSYTIGKTKHLTLGRPDYIERDKLSLSGELLSAINGAFTESAPVNKGLFKVTNTKIVEDAEIWLYLIAESTANNNVIGYYTYETGNPPATEADIKNKIIALPNAKQFRASQHFPYKNTRSYGALESGEGVQLKYWDGKNLVPRFPAGITIGWVLNSDGYKFQRCKGDGISKGYRSFYSQTNLNPETAEKNHVAMFRYKDFVAFGFEDYFNNMSDGDCNDVVFHIKSNPITAIPDVPELPEDVNDPTKEAYTVERFGTLAYEDVWPYEGDYDLNDVVVKYHSITSFNKLNEAIGVTDTYTLLWTGGKLHNGFGYQMNIDRSNIAELTINDVAAEVEPGMNKANIILFDDARAETKENTVEQVYVVKMKFKQRIPYNAFENAPYNPYIRSDNNAAHEIHLPNFAPTAKADKSLFGTGLDQSVPAKNLYYISKDAFPFAIHITGKDQYVIAEERTRIDASYPQFSGWVASKGSTNQDWYKHPAK